MRDPGHYQETYQLEESVSVLQGTPLRCQTSHYSHFPRPGFSRCFPLLLQATQLEQPGSGWEQAQAVLLTS